jgi:asparagine synthase (glutamine-hydrolysing)
MNKNQGLEKAPDEMPGEARPQWFAAFTDIVPDGPGGFGYRLVAGNARSRALYLGTKIGNTLPACAQRSGSGVIFDGVLYNREELRDELGDSLTASGQDDAALVLAGYLRWGEKVLNRLRGTFALVIYDSLQEVLLCLRDPFGNYPVFYAGAGQELLVSTSIDVLVGHPHVSRAVNRAAMADYLVDRFPKLDETFFEAVRRVPPGHVLRISRQGRRSYRYWDPAPEGETNWASADEIERFDELLDRAVKRCLSFGPTGIFLSGGLDSVTVAAFAAEQCRTEGLSDPWALSLVFPHPQESEETVQRSVAAQLGLRQILKPFHEATGSEGLLAAALEQSNSLPAPLMNTWLPAYYGLAQEGKRQGCQVILTGGGGDEWLGVSPFLGADLLRAFDLPGLYRLWQMQRRSYRTPNFALMWCLLWRFGAQPLLVPPAHRFVKREAPWALRLRHRLSPRPPKWVNPKWLAPDSSLRQQLDQRRDEHHANGQQASGSFYIREMRRALDHPVISWEMEELFEVYQRAGMRVLQPFWDADLVDLLYRIPPFLLIRGGRSKGLVRASVSRRFPSLGFDQQRKLLATRFYAYLIYGKGGEFWRKSGARTLAKLGIVDEKSLRPVFEQLLARSEERNAYRVWNVLNLESWARGHVS